MKTNLRQSLVALVAAILVSLAGRLLRPSLKPI